MSGTPSVITFMPYQRAWFQDQARFKIGMFARQTGKTFTTGNEIVDDCVQAEIEGRKARWVILSRGERQAKEVMDETIKPSTKAFYTIHNVLKSGPQFTEDTFKDSSGVSYRSLEVEFPGGSRITALPANADTARGFSANVFLDEFAFHDNSRKIWAALFPVVSKRGLRLRITSTPNGKANKFYELWTAKDTTWSRHKVDIHQAVAMGLDRDIAELRAGLNDEEIWRQEYELEFLDEASAWLPYDLITSCEHPDAGKPGLYTNGPCFVGVDIAARKDLFVIAVLELVGDVLWCRELIVEKGISFAEQDRLLAGVFNRYQVLRCSMDQTGMGEKPVEDAKRNHGQYRVEGVQFNQATKLNMATIAKEGFEDRRVRIPQGDTELRGDLHSLMRILGPTGTPLFVADRSENGHADRTWALFLAQTAASQGGQQPWEPASAGLSVASRLCRKFVSSIRRDHT